MDRREFLKIFGVTAVAASTIGVGASLASNPDFIRVDLGRETVVPELRDGSIYVRSDGRWVYVMDVVDMERKISVDLVYRSISYVGFRPQHGVKNKNEKYKLSGVVRSFEFYERFFEIDAKAEMEFVFVSYGVFYSFNAMLSECEFEFHPSGTAQSTIALSTTGSVMVSDSVV